MRFFKSLAFILIFTFPVWAPEAFIALGLMVWTAVYAVCWVASIGSNMSDTLPWMLVSPDRSIWSTLIFIALLGLLAGPRGSLAMLAVYAPAWILPLWLLYCGVAIEYNGGWERYLLDNYDHGDCSAITTVKPSPGNMDCKYQPLLGHRLPSFVARETEHGRIMLVIPYSVQASAAQYVPAVQPAVNRAETVKTLSPDEFMTVMSGGSSKGLPSKNLCSSKLVVTGSGQKYTEFTCAQIQ
jgi:hypothetical protein